MHIHKFADLAVFDEVGVPGNGRVPGFYQKTSSGADTDRKADHPLTGSNVLLCDKQGKL